MADFEVTEWETRYLNTCGRYRSPEIEGFPYRYGQWVPVNERYSAMLEHRWALRAHARQLTKGIVE